jgi:pilus assembly protein Flp/PilA
MRARNVLGLSSQWCGPRQARRLSRRDHDGRRHSKVLTFIREDEGQGLVEYALIIAVIAIAVIVAMVFLRGQIQNIFSNIGNNLT